MERLRIRWALILAALNLLMGFTPPTAEAANSVSGEAYGGFVDVDAAGGL
jgi:hypothetical protein